MTSRTTDYFPGGQVESVRNANGARTTHTLDGLNRVTQASTLVDGKFLISRVDYDPNGNKEMETDRRNVTRRFVYDALNRVRSVQLVSGLSGEGPVGEIATFVVPDVMEAVAPEVVVPLPEPAPVKKEAVAKKKVEKPAPKPVKQKVEKPAPKKTSKPAASASAEAKSAPQGAAGVSKPRVSSASWKAKVVSWLRRHQRYPAGAKSQRQEGNVQVAFTIDAGGRVKSARISRSSGNADLDRAALDMVRRSSPVPAPPEGETTRSLVVPVAFNLK